MLRALVIACLLGVVALQSSLAHAQASQPPAYYASPPPMDPKPRGGVGGVVVGAAGFGLAVLNLATLPICYASFYPSEAEGACVVLSGVFAGLGVTAGITGLAIGIPRRKRYKAWKARQRASLLEGLRLTPTAQGGAGLTWGTRF
jgi:hypothetical protein